MTILTFIWQSESQEMREKVVLKPRGKNGDRYYYSHDFAANPGAAYFLACYGSDGALKYLKEFQVPAAINPKNEIDI
ncbi:hypothetical protein HGA64_05395 [Candidatus Falkowbacteria bacterium]|nr:hypothetical protein [Candidatus Falkowbacteria bacterium]